MKSSKKEVDKPKDEKTKLAEQLMQEYDKQKQGELDRQALAELLQDAYKIANRKAHVSKEDLNMLISMLDKDGDGRITMADLEFSVGKIMLKKEKQEQERKEDRMKRDEERKTMHSPIRERSTKPAAKPKDKPPTKISSPLNQLPESTPPKSETKEKTEKQSEKKPKKNLEEKESKPEKSKTPKETSVEKPKKEEKNEEKKKKSKK